MLIDILNQYTPSKSTDQNQSELTNMYLEEDQSSSGVKGEYKVVAYSTFGLQTFCNTTKAVVRALYEHNDVLYAVAGDTFYSINSAGTASSLGTLNTSTGFAKIVSITGGSDTNNQLIIIDGTNGYSYNVGTSTATFPISDVDFPDTCTDITTQDDYVIVEKSGSMSFYLSDLSDSTTWATLDFASKFRKPDRLVAINANKGELWLLGSKSVEIWVNTGNASFPFERRSDVLIEGGCAAKRSVVVAGNTLFYLAKNSNGGYGVVAVEAYQPKVVSTKAIMYQLSQLTSVSDCIAYAYAKDGHECIDFTFPTDNKTFTYDLSVGIWLNRQSYVSSTYGRFLGNCHAFCYGKSLVGDYNSGIIYTQSSAVYTENGVAIRRRFVSPPVYSGGKYLYIHRLQIDVQTNVGSSKTFLLEMSTDRGITWTTVDTYTIPTDGAGTIYTSSLGAAFCFLFRITTTDNFNFTLLGMQADATVEK